MSSELTPGKMLVFLICFALLFFVLYQFIIWLKHPMCGSHLDYCGNEVIQMYTPDEECRRIPCEVTRTCNENTVCEKGACYKFDTQEHPVCYPYDPCQTCRRPIDCVIEDSTPARVRCG